MTTNYKVLGQSAPAATTLTTLYTVPASTQAVGSTIVVCNRGTTATKFRIAVRPTGTAIADEHYIYYDVPISANNVFTATLGMTLGATDVVSVYATDAQLSFSLFGQENT